MITPQALRKLALSFPEAEEMPHFEKTSFRIRKKIFATLDMKNQRCVVKLSVIDQSVFCGYNIKIVYPVKGAWGRQGWTIIELRKVSRPLFADALTTAYCTVAPEKFARMVRPPV
jgi:hypothetical protein